MHVPGDGEKHKLEERVWKAKQADSKELREELLKEYKQYIVKVASRICRRSVTVQDDEFAIAMLGFNEAIDRYEREQPSSFLSFAYMVIQRRLIDFYRREQKYSNQVPLTPPDSRESEPNHPEMVDRSFQRFREEELAKMRRVEIAQFTQALGRFGIRMEDLVKASPKHRDTREEMLKIAQAIVKEPELLKEFHEQTKIKKPFAERIGCHRRTLKRHRTYLIALTLVLVEDLPMIREYLGLPAERKGGGVGAKGNRDGSQTAVLGGHDTGW